MTSRAALAHSPHHPSELPARKPLLRGWIHLIAAPIALLAGLIAIFQPDHAYQQVSVAVFAVCSVILFGTSAVYHLGNWTPKVRAVLRRVDHSNIFLLIAGTYTPLAVLLLETRQMILLLSVIWAGALVGIAVRQLWLSAPRWVYVTVYLLLGWVAIWFLPEFYQAGGSAVVWCIVLGGAFYSLGAAAYGLKRPNPFPNTFGFHEIFHLCTVIAWASHATAIVLAWS